MIVDMEKIAQDYLRDGVVKIPKLFSTETIAQIRAELERYCREDLDSKPTDARTLEQDDQTIRNLWRLEQHNEFFRELSQQPKIIELVSKLIGAEPVLRGVETFNKPAKIGSAVPYHQDNAYFCQVPADMLTLWVAIDPVTVENGPVYYIKQSHKLGLLPTKKSGVKGNSIGLADIPSTPLAEQFCATLGVGDAVIHHCETIHHSAANRSQHSRLGLLFVFHGTHTKTDPLLISKYEEAVTATPPA